MKKFTNEEFINAVRSNTTTKQVLISLGLLVNGGNYRIFNHLVSELNVDVDHLKQPKASNKKIEMSKILVKNSNYSRQKLKARLLKEDYLKNKCYICNQEPIWKEKKLVFILDHINGDPQDNRLENLRLVCPNCGSQLDTFSGRNKASKRLPIPNDFLSVLQSLGTTSTATHYNVTRQTVKKWRRNLETKISLRNPVILNKCICGDYTRGKMCISCRKAERRKHIPNKETLQKEIEITSWRDLGKKYNVSDNAVRKWAKKYKIIA